MIIISIFCSGYEQIDKINLIRIAIINIFALVLNTAVVFIMKFGFKRKRKAGDYYFIRKIDPYSFPSGHVSRLAGFVFSSLSFPPLSVLFFLFCLSTSLTRMIKGYHYFSDCYAGFAVGLAGGTAALFFSRYYADSLINLMPFI